MSGSLPPGTPGVNLARCQIADAAVPMFIIVPSKECTTEFDGVIDVKKLSRAG